MVASSSSLSSFLFLFWGGRGPVSFRGCEGGRAFVVAVVVAVVLSVFVLGRAGASQLPGCEGGNVLSQLWSLVVVASPSVFVLGGAGGQSASGL